MSNDALLRPEDVAGVPDDLLLPHMGWGIAAVCRHFGVPSLRRWIEVLDSFRLGAQLAAISCPVLGLVGDHEGPEVLAQADTFLGGVAGAGTLRRFPLREGADAHGQAGNRRLRARVVFDWLDDQLAGQPPSGPR